MKSKVAKFRKTGQLYMSFVSACYGKQKPELMLVLNILLSLKCKPPNIRKEFHYEILDNTITTVKELSEKMIRDLSIHNMDVSEA